MGFRTQSKGWMQFQMHWHCLSITLRMSVVYSICSYILILTIGFQIVFNISTKTKLRVTWSLKCSHTKSQTAQRDEAKHVPWHVTPKKKQTNIAKSSLSLSLSLSSVFTYPMLGARAELQCSVLAYFLCFGSMPLLVGSIGLERITGRRVCSAPLLSMAGCRTSMFSKRKYRTMGHVALSLASIQDYLRPQCARMCTSWLGESKDVSIFDTTQH